MANILEGKNILVTGASGFLGRHVGNALRAEGAEVVPFTGNLLSKGYSIDTVALASFRDIDLLIHLAGDVAGAAPNRLQPYRFLRNNTLMALRAIELALWLDVPVVAAGSVCAYSSEAGIPFIEEQFWLGKPDEANYGYGVAKRVLGAALESAYRQEGLRYVHLISANLYGPGDSFRDDGHVIPMLIKRFMDAKRNDDAVVTIWGSGMPTRDFLYVKDAAEAYVDAARYLFHGLGPLDCNIGSGEEVSIAYAASAIRLLTGYQGRIEYDASRRDGQMRRQVDSSRATQTFGWKAKTSFEDGLRETIEWYRKQVA